MSVRQALPTRRFCDYKTVLNCPHEATKHLKCGEQQISRLTDATIEEFLKR